ncbi:hypothetical protein [Hydrogenophaga sp.]|uniref:hypothetical protein n=1 Tax=Hydrogenophaga sp. TaxID=1904254 RepID=UPI0027306358|nr:hypothetical protein [Hydrogenophaga sp.]MDP2015421.1 hypothetical protein [Hydrogenophaga sp.]MDP3166720.1 hypothetical protein [Hydrogenophaga sp.]
MYPWLWFWAPQIHFPWSGAVSQNIEPRTAWFTDHIPVEAGNASIEAKVTELASYGKQLGMITEALIGIAEQSRPTDRKTKDAIGRLKDLQTSIDTIKEQEYRCTAERLVKEIQELKRRGGPEYQGIAEALLPLLSGKRSA